MNTFRKILQLYNFTTNRDYVTPPPPKKNVLSKTEYRKGAAGYRQGADRVPSDALPHQTGPVCMPAAPGRDPCGLLKGTLRLQIIYIYRASSGLRWICDHGGRRNEIRKGPARSRNSTASRRVRKSYGARWICESPLSRRLIDRSRPENNRVLTNILVKIDFDSGCCYNNNSA